jgi:DNA-binding LacI/PurR family transcriptional regulator
MADVGRLAGVSHQTVSRVINGSPNVRPSTRDRVLAAMEELGYMPNSVARALVTGRSRTLGVVSFDTTLYGPASTMLGIERAAHEAGYFTVIASLTSLSRASVTEAIERLRRHGVDGVLVIAPFIEASVALPAISPGLPLVGVEASPQEGVSSVGVDQTCGAQLATRHLLELGHRTVWHIAGPQDFHEARERLAAWQATLTEAGAEVPEPLVGDWSPRRGYELGAQLPRDASAVFVGNDQMALGVLRALNESGRSVPGDVSVVGFDDIPEAAYFLPPLTTIRQDFDEMGGRAVRLLLELVGDGPGDPVLPVEPTLVERESTAPNNH